MNEAKYHKFHINQDESGLIPPASGNDGNAGNINLEFWQPKESLAPTVLTTQQALQNAERDARQYFGNVTADDDLYHVIALRNLITKQKAKEIADRVFEEMSRESR